ncbi:sigma-70 family RNA polymerase sigma factor, partial [Candidatus Parcubacteria bacterium]
MEEQKNEGQEPSDAVLVQRCLAGDQRAWQALVDRYAALVHSVPARYGLPPMEVEDVAQEVFLALARNLDRIEEPQALPSWLLITARRLSWRALARQQREAVGAQGDVVEDNLAPLSSSAPTIEELIQTWSRQEMLREAFAQLSPRCRQLLALLFLDPAEPSYAEISE